MPYWYTLETLMQLMLSLTIYIVKMYVVLRYLCVILEKYTDLRNIYEASSEHEEFHDYWMASNNLLSDMPNILRSLQRRGISLPCENYYNLCINHDKK